MKDQVKEKNSSETTMPIVAIERANERIERRKTVSSTQPIGRENGSPNCEGLSPEARLVIKAEETFDRHLSGVREWFGPALVAVRSVLANAMAYLPVAYRLAFVAVIVVVIAQNSGPSSLNLLFWEVLMPKSLVLTAIILLGFGCGVWATNRWREIQLYFSEKR